VLSESNPPRVNARSVKYSDTDSVETLTLIPGPVSVPIWRSVRYSDSDSIETLTPIPGPDYFETLTPIPDTDSFETLTPIPDTDSFETPIPDTDAFKTLSPIPDPVSVPRSPSGSANAKDHEDNGAGGLWEILIRFWDLGFCDLGMNFFS